MKQLIPIGLLLTLIVSCSPVYIPNNHSAPLLREKGEVHAAINEGSNGRDLKFAVSPIAGIGVIAGYQHTKVEEDDFRDTGHVFKLDYKELGLGRYGMLGKSFILESYLGAGTGWMEGNESYFFSRNETVRGKYRKYFMLTNFGQSFRFLDWGIGFRFSYVDFYSFKSAQQEVYVTGKKSAFFMEDHVFLRAGPELIKFQLQIGLAKAYRKLAFDYDPLYISLGVHLNFKYAK